VVSIARLQTYLRSSARRQYETVSAPPFTLFFHPTDPLTFFNYAIPDEPCSGDLGASLSVLREAFESRGRSPRIEFIQEFAPRLAPALAAGGLVPAARQQLMACKAATYRPAPGVTGLTIAELIQASAVPQAQEFLAPQRRGFDVRDTSAATEGDGEQFLRMLGEGQAFVAYLKGQPVAVGMYTAPLDGVTEIAGLATLVPFRKRGIATALTALAVQRALEQGVEAVCLTAADERAGRVYERVGFATCATMLAYVDSPEEMSAGASTS